MENTIHPVRDEFSNKPDGSNKQPVSNGIHLIVKRSDQTINDLKFDKTPVYLGRKTGIQVFLPDAAVSREHAVIYLKEDKWQVEDLDSANKTYLNGEAIHKAEIKTGDIVKISDFTVEIDLGDNAKKEPEHTSGSDDTVALEAASLSTPRDEVIVRRPDASHAPAMRLAARRLTDFAQAVEALGDAKNLDELVIALLKLSLQQFTAFHVWCGVRSSNSGPITYQAGKRRDGKPVQLSELRLAPKITDSFEKGQSLVLPQVAAKLETTDRIRSAMISSIKRPSGCFGVIYVDNAMVHEHYSLSDLDYLMILAMHTAGVLKTHL
ncbi:MAG: FHA domain-containing protein [Phycisphaerae bacterium]|jgi:pSer/pThr/pTyr-binding forkhead associated (FHA) protein